MSDINRVEAITFKCKECDFFERETCYTGHSKRQVSLEHAKETGHEIDSYCTHTTHINQKGSKVINHDQQLDRNACRYKASAA